MSALWATLNGTERAALTCMLTLLLGLFIGAAVTWWQVRVPRVVSDDPQQEYRDAAVIDWSNEVWAELDREASS